MKPKANRIANKNLTRWASGISIALIVLAAMYLWFQRGRVFSCELAAGQKHVIRIDTPMQQAFTHKSYAKQLGLPVGCRIAAQLGNHSGVSTQVIRTGHTVHWLWAEVEVTASAAVVPNVHVYTASFTIDGKGDWPQATLQVRVTR